MKLRHPLLIRIAAALAAGFIRAWMATVRKVERFHAPETNPYTPGGPKCIYAFWHEGMLLPASLYARTGAAVLISKHADGELVAQAVRRLGLNLVRGSSTRGGARAMLEMIREAKGNHIVVTPDGPRGPRREAQSGVAFLAAVTGLPVVPVGVGFRSAWRMKSWDRFAIPKPFSRACIVTGPAIRAGRATDGGSIEALRSRIQEAMLDATARAGHWEATGKFDERPFQVPAPLAKAG